MDPRAKTAHRSGRSRSGTRCRESLPRRSGKSTGAGGPGRHPLRHGFSGRRSEAQGPRLVDSSPGGLVRCRSGVQRRLGALPLRSDERSRRGPHGSRLHSMALRTTSFLIHAVSTNLGGFPLARILAANARTIGLCFSPAMDCPRRCGDRRLSLRPRDHAHTRPSHRRRRGTLLPVGRSDSSHAPPAAVLSNRLGRPSGNPRTSTTSFETSITTSV